MPQEKEASDIYFKEFLLETLKSKVKMKAG